ncbi:DUF1450 domain-containing protein [Brevibacillus centrosporus]|uniref:DUF1450 domain-containing protein n=1 Tax=Brevibacillus centrosporus TaxID=54910 RepID=UPI000F09C66B|nr:DUF1450 domain-containing protein [Brevibacillus centrosporus]MEC2131342.1 DUF1450 domain-containing protein [Brevibacillus centrosporus]RNB72624.1 DUF1450 domain-containing protein [Brevibacillus centrosporus]GED31553.1 hypothetical protein BCE02nite_26940 [Brevibacillus centrosporus]
MEHIIKFCPCNFERQLCEIKDRLRQLPNVTVTDERCLNYCGQCLEKPFALLHKKNVVGDTAEELYRLLVENLAVAEKSGST